MINASGTFVTLFHFSETEAAPTSRGHVGDLSEQGEQRCRRKRLSIIGRLPSITPTLPDTTKKQRSITTVGITTKQHIMLTPQAVMPSMPEITPKKRERRTPRNTARSNFPSVADGGVFLWVPHC